MSKIEVSAKTHQKLKQAAEHEKLTIPQWIEKALKEEDGLTWEQYQEQYKPKEIGDA